MKSEHIVFVIIGVLVLVFLGYALLGTENNETITIPPKENEGEGKFPALPDQVGLPPQVEATRQALYAAALSRDYNRLAELATYPNFSYTFGGPYPGGFIEYLKLAETTEKESVFDVIPKLLALPYAKSGGIYAWPGVFYKESSAWTEEDIASMKKILTDAEIENYRKFGGYLYYRVGIDEKGNWIFYIAGD